MSNNRPWQKLIIVTALCAGWWALLNFGVNIGSTNTPPLGSFLNPYEGFYRNNDVDYYNKNLDLPGLRAPVEVIYDSRLVPHIYASSEGDLYFAQGYIQAQHRLFQLDLTSRSAEGTLSEIIGSRTKEFDLVRRRLGGRQLAHKIDSLFKLDKRAFEAVSRYSEGVNAYISSLEPHEYPIEYKLLNFKPRQWSPEHTALVALSMAYTLNFRNEDIAATNTRALLGEQSFDFLFPERNSLVPSIIPPGTPFLEADTALIKASQELLLKPRATNTGADGLSLKSGYEKEQEGIGSNNWAISGSLSKTGSPILANDPHLGLTLPSIWFESELHTGGLHVHGVNLPGVPGITIGFNEKVAWGVTNVGIDVLDWHQIQYVDAEKTRYIDKSGKERSVSYRIEQIKVKGEPDLIDTVLITSYGPIPYTDENDYRAGLALDWLTLQKPSGETFNAFLMLNRANNTEEFIAASKRFEWPAQNMVFAEKSGDIALRISGLIPRKLPQQGRFLLSQASPQASGYLAAELNPVAVNPPQQFLASTNQISTDASYPYYYLGGFDDYRSRRINTLLSSAEKFGVDDMKAFQMDSYSVLAEDLTPVLLSGIDRTNMSIKGRGLLDILAEWDFKYTADAFAPVIFEAWKDSLTTIVWDEIPTTGGPYEQPEIWRLLELLKTDPLSPWFDIKSTSTRESARDVISQAFAKTIEPLAKLNQQTGYGWAKANEVAVMHLAKIPAFSRQNLRADGVAGALNAQNGDVGPSWRMVVRLGDPVSAEVVYPGGQSGRPGHPNYDNMVDDWASGRYHSVMLHKTPSDFTGDSILRLSFNP